jgi:hypothetical protein
MWCQWRRRASGCEFFVEVSSYDGLEASDLDPIEFKHLQQVIPMGQQEEGYYLSMRAIPQIGYVALEVEVIQ